MDRSRVESWLFHLCGLLVLGNACAVMEGNRTVCYYKDNEVVKPCQLFLKVGCQNISYTAEEWREDVDFAWDAANRHLSISQLGDRDSGFLKVYGTDCWKFKVGPTLYHENRIIMDLHFIPMHPEGHPYMDLKILSEASENDIVLHQDGGKCDYLYKSNYSLPKYIRENESLTFAITAVPEVQHIELTLSSGDCPMNCCRTDNNCSLVSEKITIKNFSKRLHLPVTTRRYHCLLVVHGHCNFCTTTVQKENPPAPPTPIPAEESIRPVVIWSSMAVVAVLLVSVLLKIICRCGPVHQESSDTGDPDMRSPWHCLQQALPPPQKVLLLYSRDCPQFCAVTQALGQLLTAFGNLKVLDPLEQNELEQVSENISGWLTQHIQNRDVKLVIVISEGAMVRQSALLNNQLVHIDEPHFLDPLFTLALQLMHENPQLGNDYTRIFPVRFEDFTPSEVSLSLVVPLKCYVLQRHLGKLIADIRAFNTTSSPDYEDIRKICPQQVTQLENVIREMTSYCAKNPHYIKGSFLLAARSQLK